MIKNLLIYLLVLSTTSCSTYRFIGNPITINSENLNIKLSEEDLVFFNENQKEIWPLLDINDDKIPGMSVNKANKELNKRYYHQILQNSRLRELVDQCNVLQQQ